MSNLSRPPLPPPWPWHSHEVYRQTKCEATYWFLTPGDRLRARRVATSVSAASRPRELRHEVVRPQTEDERAVARQHRDHGGEVGEVHGLVVDNRLRRDVGLLKHMWPPSSSLDIPKRLKAAERTVVIQYSASPKGCP